VGASIGKRKLVAMTASTELFAVHRHSFVVEAPAKVHYGGAHWITLCDGRTRETPRQIPIEIAAGQAS
jgi:hypothetical protein